VLLIHIILMSDAKQLAHGIELRLPGRLKLAGCACVIVDDAIAELSVGVAVVGPAHRSVGIEASRVLAEKA